MSVSWDLGAWRNSLSKNRLFKRGTSKTHLKEIIVLNSLKIPCPFEIAAVPSGQPWKDTGEAQQHRGSGSGLHWESQITMLVSRKACLDSLILLLDSTDSQQVTNNEPCGGYQVPASAARQWHANRAATVSQMGFPFFFSTPRLLHWLYTKIMTKCGGGTGNKGTRKTREPEPEKDMAEQQAMKNFRNGAHSHSQQR